MGQTAGVAFHEVQLSADRSRTALDGKIVTEPPPNVIVLPRERYGTPSVI